MASVCRWPHGTVQGHADLDIVGGVSDHDVHTSLTPSTHIHARPPPPHRYLYATYSVLGSAGSHLWVGLMEVEMSDRIIM